MKKDYLIKKWLKDELNDSEQESFNALENNKLYGEIIEEAKRFDGKSNTKVVPFDVLDKKLSTRNKNSLNWIKIVASIAAIFIITIFLFTLTNKYQVNSFKTAMTQNEIIKLPDNSIVNLNELSELEYVIDNWNDNRSLKLKGEAFFDVEKGKQYDVNTKFGKVSVLGTEFNVLSRDSIFKVSCYEGLVQVTFEDDKIKLPAGTELILHSGKGLKSNISVAEPYWLNNMSVFENTSFINVIHELEKQYEIKVKYSPELNLNFTGAFENNNLQNALKSITKPLNLTYVILNTNEVLIRNEND